MVAADEGAASARAAKGEDAGGEAPGNPQAADEVAGRPWQAVLDSVLPALVALRVTAVRSFQDDHAGAHEGTGFVVDAERGLLLTNRHVCTCGPARATATFVGCPSMEEVAVSVAYLDPVHDFALFRFDPAELRQTPHCQIELDPSGCRVGEEVRVIGNDSLEKLQILSGTIARVDRDAPELSGDYADENTFYAMAASGTRGGSSGSPVLSSRGKAIALNAAAATGTMHGFYLPLHRVKRALDLLQAGRFVTRGTLCAQLSYTSFPECHRFGVSKDFISDLVVGRSPPPGGTFTATQPPGGLLQVKCCVPGTQASKILKPGDVLLELEGRTCVDFVHFDDILDEAVGKAVKVAVCRGGARVDLELDVQDMHSLIPHGFMELGLGVFHEVPYQTARKHHVPMRGIYVAQAGFVFGEAVKCDSVILELNGNPCDDLQRFERELEQIDDDEYFTVSWMVPKNARERRPIESFVKMQRQWFMSRCWSLDRVSRIWTPRRLASSPIRTETAAAEEEDASCAAAAEPSAKRRRGSCCGAQAALEKTICAVTFRTVQNLSVDIVADMSALDKDVYVRNGAGVIVDAEAGFVLTDRATVPQPLGDIEVTLGDVNRSASVCFMHPNHSVVLLKLAAGSGSLCAFGKSATFLDHEIEEGSDELDFVGIDVEGKRSSSKVKVRSVGLANFPRPFPPKWHERNVEAIILEDDPPNMNGGVICNEAGSIYGVYSVASVLDDSGERQDIGYALPSYIVMPLLENLQGGTGCSPLAVPSLEIQLCKVELAHLRRLPPKLRPTARWLRRQASVSTGEPEGEAKGGWALQVAGVTAGGPCDGLVAPGDILGAVGGVEVATARAMEECLSKACAAGAKEAIAPTLVLSLLRGAKTRDVNIRVPLLFGDGSKRMLCWNGLMLEDTPRSVREHGAVPPGIHISDLLLGSPGEAYGIEGDFLLAVDGVKTPTLEALLAVRSEGQPPLSAGRLHLRVETADMSGRRFVKALEPDPLYWPTTVLELNSNGKWSCNEHPA